MCVAEALCDLEPEQRGKYLKTEQVTKPPSDLRLASSEGRKKEGTVEEQLSEWDRMGEKGQRGPRGGPNSNPPPIPPETMTMNIQLNMQHAAMQQTMRMMNVIREYCCMGCPRNSVITK
ncbi:hypothetical protein Pcinc_006612 [Petrolisthes cinctipes]|uniref:Uncharacterized protein n=1 Tax=Petrolisthes cinctipes TaxID=88211 RepID=A0AAE1GCV9_PETCI|nr:hypothetical protein Pcinc_006612 [Petrolisthes cinctipes]